jgi:hypothetical protein
VDVPSGDATSTGGSGGTGGSSGSADCVVPTDTVSLAVSSADAVEEADGTFASTSDGFTVTSATETISISGVHPAVPQGTFVHITYGGTQGFYGPPGGFVRLDNLATLDGQPNPTEAGARLWYFAASQGGTLLTMSPFTATAEAACFSGSGSLDSGSTTVESLVLTGPGFDVTIPPSAEATFTATSGDHAGSYVAKNVNVAFVGAPGGDAWTITNFTIARSP